MPQIVSIGSRATMHDEIAKMMYETLENLHKARDMKNPVLAQAVLVNLHAVLPSYIDELASVNA